MHLVLRRRSASSQASAGWFLVFFLAGFAALACIWAVAGSLATRSEDLQSTTPVLTTILMGAMFVGLFGEGTVRVVASYLPVVSAISMPAAAAERRGRLVGAGPVAARDAGLRRLDHGRRRTALPAVDHCITSHESRRSGSAGGRNIG